MPSSERLRETPAPATAISISVRGIKRKYASLVLIAGFGNRNPITNSSAERALVPTPVTNSSTAICLSPEGPEMTQTAEFAIRAGIVSPAGDALHRLPAMVALP